MRIIIPHTITEAMLIDSNVPENDYAAWSASTTYAVDAKVIRSHKIYQAVAASTGQDPVTDTAEAYWVALGATNRWRAFDSRIGGVVTGPGPTITYKIRLDKTLDSMCLFGINATTITLTAQMASASSPFWSQTVQLASRPDVTNFWTYVFDQFDYRPDVVLTGLNLPSGCDVSISINAGSTAGVGEIFLGRNIIIGDTQVGSSLGIVDYSTKERDSWGGLYIVQRPTTKTVSFVAKVETANAAKIQSIIEGQVTSTVCVFFSGDGEDFFGTTVAGILRDYDLTLAAVRSELKLEVESLA